VSRRAAVAAITAASILGSCGGIKAPDLFIVERTGTVPGARLTLVVNEEGGVRCNGEPTRPGKTLKLSDPQLVEARAIQEALHDPASRHLSLSPGPGSVFSYYVRDENGTVRFSDNSPSQPHVLRQLQLFVLQSSRALCHLPL
jgi:hypothetical protein